MVSAGRPANPLLAGPAGPAGTKQSLKATMAAYLDRNFPGGGDWGDGAGDSVDDVPDWLVDYGLPVPPRRQ